MAVAEVMSVIPDLVDTPTLLLIGVGSGVEDDAVTRLERGLRVKGNEVGADSGDGSEKGAAFFPEAGMDQLLMVHPVHPSGVEPAGEGHFELVAILVTRLPGLTGQSGVDRLSVNLTDGRHILGSLQPPLDLEARDTRGDEFGNVVYRRKILGREEVALVAEIAQCPVHDEFVGHAAGLGTFTPVGTPLTKRLAGEALAGVGHAECPVYKDL